MANAAQAMGRQMLEGLKAQLDGQAADIKVSLASWESRSPADQSAHLARAVEGALRLPMTLDVAGLFALVTQLDNLPKQTASTTRDLIRTYGDY